MEFVFFITGNVEHPLTIDPTVWIFDDRKVDLTTYFTESKKEEDSLTAYKKAISAQWDKEITEGAQPPSQTNDNRVSFKKEELLHGTFAMKLEPFLSHTKPVNPSALAIETTTGEMITLDWDKATSCLLKFSDNGKPLTENGPVHILYGDGSNLEAPITNVAKLIVK
ncbi:peptidyl-prolyl cis-trans isomerase [Alkalihalobacillus sp. LMS39]|uniref:peptidyl-prolyl cis-trans isomerase n=1 Tax=Alkalihalobacillus sp. LMS39 TaxID=2924032 RepID=UPI0032614053